MTRKFIIALSYFVLINVQISYCQFDLYRPTIISPNASSISLFGEIPVSHFTGTADISVPFYEIKTKSLIVPINLRYHTAGIRPEQHPGWVGVGWNLNAGGAISRRIRKFRDEQKGGQEKNNLIGYYYNHYLKNDNWAQFGVGDLEHEAGVASLDLEADEFSFNFLGYSGKFYFDAIKNEFVVQSDQNLKVSLDSDQEFIFPWLVNAGYGLNAEQAHNPIQQTFNKFIITDDKGNKFIFGGNDAIEYTEEINPENEGADLSATTWNLVKVITANSQDIIDFEYERGPYIGQLYKYANYQYFKSDCELTSIANWRNAGSFIIPVYLRKIKVQNGVTVDFSISKSDDLKYGDLNYILVAGGHDSKRFGLLNFVSLTPYYKDNLPTQLLDRLIWLKLDAIKVLNQDGAVLKNMVLNYNNIPKERLFLENVVFTSSNDVPGEKYAFHYLNKEKMPLYLECITDHWGFNNGKYYGDFNRNTISSAREMDPAYGKIGILDSVYYPTGGKTAFEYESHSFSSVVTRNRTQLKDSTNNAGGVRIRKITSFDRKGSAINTKTYKYVKSYADDGKRSSGILNSIPIYNIVADNAKDKVGKNFSVIMAKSNPVLPLTDESGLYIGYTEVAELQSSGGDNSAGFTVFTYTNHSNGYNDDQANFLYNRFISVYDESNSRDFERGRLLRTDFYNSFSNTIKSVENIWSRDVSEIPKSSVRSIAYDWLRTACQSGRFLGSGVSYLNYTYPFVLSETLESEMGAVKRTTYTYAGKRLTESSQLGSKGEIKTTKYTYPSSFIYPGPNDYTLMNSSGMSGIPIETRTYITEVSKSPKLINAQIVDYYYLEAGNLIVPRQILSFERNSAADFVYVVKETKHNGNKGLSYDSRYQKKIQFNDYDAKGNVLSLSVAAGPQINYIWGYLKQYPIAKIENANGPNEFFYDGFEENTDASVVTGTSHTGNKHWNGNYKPAFVAPAGRNYIIQWWNHKDGKWSFNQQAYTAGLTLTGPLDDIRIFPAESKMTTYTYTPQVGMTSQTDEKGQTTYYEYDGFQRLISVKDQNLDVIKSNSYNFKN